MTLPCTTYEITLTTDDNGHQNGRSTDQWSLECLDADGIIIYTSPAANDLPNNKSTQTRTINTANLTGIVALQADHARLATATLTLTR